MRRQLSKPSIIPSTPIECHGLSPKTRPSQGLLAGFVLRLDDTMSDSTNPIAAFSWTGVHRREQWPGIATLLVGGGAEAYPNSKAMLADLIVAQAHRAVDQDIMVTTSPCLLQRRTDASVSETNPRLPSETAQIVGLCLRTRNNDATNCGH